MDSKSNTYILAKYDVSGIQQYIFATNRLRENVGASFQVTRILEEYLPEAIKAATAPQQENITESINVLDWKIPVSYTHLDVYKRQYQMYAYQKKYNARNVTVLYPLTVLAVPDRQIMYKSGDGADISCLLYSSRCV